MIMPTLAARLTALLFGLLLAPSLIACPQDGVRIGYIDLGANYHAERGIDVDLITEMSRRLNCKITHAQEYPRLRTLKMLQNGELNVLPSIAVTPEREKLGYMLVYEQTKNMTILHKSLPPQNAEALLKNSQLRWGRVRGFVYSPQQNAFLDQLQQQQRIVFANDSNDLFRLLSRKAVDGILAHPLVYDNKLEELHLEKQVNVYDAFPQDETIRAAIMLSRTAFSEADAQLWQQTLNQIKQDGTLQTIFLRHLSKNTAQHLRSDTTR